MQLRFTYSIIQRTKIKSAIKIHLKNHLLLLLAVIGCPLVLSAKNTFPSTGQALAEIADLLWFGQPFLRFR